MKRKLLYISFIFILLVGQFVQPKALEAFEIDDYTVEMKVNEDGTLDVKEYITVTFSEARRGIYRNIPTKYTMDWGDSIQKYTWPIKNIDVNQPFSVDYESEGASIRIGDSDVYVNGTQFYEISYTIYTTDLELSNDMDMLYFNIIPYNWDTFIHQANFTIQFPKSIDFESFYKHSSIEENLACSYDSNRYTISCSSSDSLLPYEGVTIEQSLGSNYFTFPSFEYLHPYALGISACITILFIVLYFKYGKDDPIIETVEFTAPDGLSSAACGYVIDNTVSNQDITSLFIEWGRDGYLTLKELDADTLELTKNKDMGKEKDAYERRLFNALFKNRETVTTEELSTTFYKHIEQCKEDLHVYFSTKKRKLYHSNSYVLQGFTLFFASIPITLTATIGLTKSFFQVQNLLFPFAIVFVTLVLHLIVATLIRNKYRIFTNAQKVGYLTLETLFGILTILLYLVLLFFRGNSILYAVSALVMTFLLFMISVFMSKRTIYGNKLYGQVLGLRNFIVTAEEDRLRVLAKENPYIFYDILPYAYAFGLTDVWHKHFEVIDIPESTFYYGYNPGLSTYWMLHHLSHSMNHLQSSMVSIPEVQSGSGGGNFGSGGGFGGGGFSGGGFGGGGGGSW